MPVPQALLAILLFAPRGWTQELGPSPVPEARGAAWRASGLDEICQALRAQASRLSASMQSVDSDLAILASRLRFQGILLRIRFDDWLFYWQSALQGNEVRFLRPVYLLVPGFPLSDCGPAWPLRAPEDVPNVVPPGERLV